MTESIEQRLDRLEREHKQTERVLVNVIVGLVSRKVETAWEDYPATFGQQVGMQSGLPRDLQDKADAFVESVADRER